MLRVFNPADTDEESEGDGGLESPEDCQKTIDANHLCGFNVGKIRETWISKSDANECEVLGP